MAGTREHPRLEQFDTVLDGASATGFGTAIDVGQERNIAISVATSGSANLTVKFYVSIDSTEPTWSSAAAQGNTYGQVVAYDLSDVALTAVNQVSASGSDIVANYLISVDNVKWFNAEVSTYSAGDVNLKAFYVNNG